jgi:hypothetical protein
MHASRRTRYRQSRAYGVPRFWNNDMLTDIRSVPEVVRKASASAAPLATANESGGPFSRAVTDEPHTAVTARRVPAKANSK